MLKGSFALSDDKIVMMVWCLKVPLMELAVATFFIQTFNITAT
jgi:hypothetical protein